MKYIIENILKNNLVTWYKAAVIASFNISDFIMDGA